MLPTEPYPTHTLTSWVPFPNNIRTAIDLSHKHPAHLNRSCPAVSQICSFTVFPPTLTILLPNSTPIVWLESWRTTQTSRRYTLWVKERILKIDRCFAKLSTWVGCLVILRLTVYTAIVNRELPYNFYQKNRYMHTCNSQTQGNQAGMFHKRYGSRLRHRKQSRCQRCWGGGNEFLQWGCRQRSNRNNTCVRFCNK